MKKPDKLRKPLKVKLDYVSVLLDTVNERVKAAGSEIYERECGVNVRQMRVLRAAAHEPGMTRARLIEHVHLEKTLASKTVTELVRRGLMSRTVGATDARQVCLELTDEGEAIVLQAEPIGRRLEATARGLLGAQRYDTLIGCLQQLAQFGEDASADVERHLKRSASRRRG
ncbi:MarR family winged helix-turn-helix transcriptional regulator [Variovorax sp. PBL-E5]|uniref:MarR family winged helix-turn-helix transcriptional regulator n=1 Tax=Variovorax sp. PBL-E5 TaxID=434014 RepID=UPI001315D5AB|nr:MarR family transcriptional regulator [Variovorax sp. PBL-E5]VTU25178.1 Transcriptional regulator HosA [Variovorax sp. PBL-E5]